MPDARRMNEGPAAQPLRLAPEMASLRLQVLAFVRVYVSRWGESPSYGEIGEGIGASRTAIKKAVRRLIAQGLLLRTPGARGLMVPDRRDEALRLLRELGWTIDADRARLIPPNGQEVTNRALLGAVVLDYDPGKHTIGDGGNGAEKGKGRGGGGQS